MNCRVGRKWYPFPPVSAPANEVDALIVYAEYWKNFEFEKYGVCAVRDIEWVTMYENLLINIGDRNELRKKYIKSEPPSFRIADIGVRDTERRCH